MPSALLLVSTATNTVTSENFTANISNVAVSPDGTKLYITNPLTGALFVRKSDGVTLLAAVPVMGLPSGVFVPPNGSAVYVTSTANTLYAVSTATDTVTAKITLPHSPTAIAFSPDSTTAYLSVPLSNALLVMSVASNTVIATIPLGLEPYNAVVSADGTKIYVTSLNSHLVSVVSTASGTVIATVDIGATSAFAALSPDGTSLYVTIGAEVDIVNNIGTGVVVISTATDTITGTVGINIDVLTGLPLGGANITNVCVSPDGTKIYVVDRSNGYVITLNAATLSVTALVFVGNFVDGLAISPDGTVLYVVSEGYSIGSPLPPPPPPPPPFFLPPSVPTGDLAGTETGPGGAGLAAGTVSLVSGRSGAADPVSGAYAVTQIPIGLYSALYAACGFVPQLQLVTLVAGQTTTENVILAAHSASDGLGYLCGWAVDQVSGVPLAGATVTAGSSPASSFSATTDAGGGFILLLPVGTYTVTVAAFGYSLFSWGAPVTVQNSCPVIIRPGGGPPTGDGAILGYIEDALSFTALSGADVFLSGYTDDLTQADGSYGFRFLSTPGLETLTATAAGYRARRSQVYLNPGDTARVDLGLVPVGTAVGAIDGFVTDAVSGQGLGGVVVRIPGLVQAVTTSAGYFLLDTLPAGAAAVQAILDGYQPQQVVVTVTANSTTRQNFRLAGWNGTQSALCGQVRDALTAAPLVGAAVVVDGGQTILSAAGGAYLVIFPVPPVVHDLRCTDNNYYPFEEGGLPVGFSQTVVFDIGLVSTATPVGSMHGLVLDARHSSVRLGGALVSVGRFLMALATFPQGEYTLPYVPSGVAYTGTASINDYVPLTVHGIETQSGQTLEMDWPLTAIADEFQPRGTLTVLVIEAGSLLPLAGALVTTGAFGVSSAVTDSTGTVVLPGLLPGNYTVSASLTNYRVGTAQAVVLPGPNTATLTLRGFPDNYQGGEVYGYVTAALLPPGLPVAGCLVSANPRTNAAFLSGWTGPDVVTNGAGFYVLDNVPAGVTALTFDDPDYDVLTISGVGVTARAAARQDATLSPYDGRVPAGWRIVYGQVVALDRAPDTAVVTLRGNRSADVAAQATTVALLAQIDTLALGRYRRVRYDVRMMLSGASLFLKEAVLLAPGTQIEGMPLAMTLPAPPVGSK